MEQGSEGLRMEAWCTCASCCCATLALCRSKCGCSCCSARGLGTTDDAKEDTIAEEKESQSESIVLLLDTQTTKVSSRLVLERCWCPACTCVWEPVCANGCSCGCCRAMSDQGGNMDKDNKLCRFIDQAMT